MAGRLIPKTVWLDPTRYLIVRIVPQAEIAGARGEWAANDPPDGPCFGVARIAKELDPFERWLVYREELQHALIDFQRWRLYDYDDDDDPADPAGAEHVDERDSNLPETANNTETT